MPSIEGVIQRVGRIPKGARNQSPLRKPYQLRFSLSKAKADIAEIEADGESSLQGVSVLSDTRGTLRRKRRWSLP